MVCSPASLPFGEHVDLADGRLLVEDNHPDILRDQENALIKLGELYRDEGCVHHAAPSAISSLTSQ